MTLVLVSNYPESFLVYRHGWDVYIPQILVVDLHTVLIQWNHWGIHSLHPYEKVWNPWYMQMQAAILWLLTLQLECKFQGKLSSIFEYSKMVYMKNCLWMRPILIFVLTHALALSHSITSPRSIFLCPSHSVYVTLPLSALSS